MPMFWTCSSIVYSLITDSNGLAPSCTTAGPSFFQTLELSFSKLSWTGLGFFSGVLSLGGFSLIQQPFFFFCLFFTWKKECTLFRLISVWFCKSIGLCWISCVDLLFYCWELMESDIHHKPEIQAYKSSELEKVGTCPEWGITALLPFQQKL